MSTPEPHGIEAQVCADIASRQKLGMSKYGTSVADSPLTETQWLQHAYEEALDLSIYLKRIIQMKNNDTPAVQPAPQFRFFKDADGWRYKMPGFAMAPRASNWVSSLATMMDIENRCEVDGTIETDADGNPLTVAEIPVTEQPSKAREWWLTVRPRTEMPDWAIMHTSPGDDGISGRVHVREVIPGEEPLVKTLSNISRAYVSLGEQLTQVTKQRDEAVGLLRTAEAYPEIGKWLSTNFPQPEPEPFDMEKLWAMLPPWITFVAMDEDGEYTGFQEEPQCVTEDYGRSWTQFSEFAVPIPPEFAPPPAADWKTSLVKRPTPASHDM